ncbi:hypothetical protein YC2023_016551 [Brassica napus]
MRRNEEEKILLMNGNIFEELFFAMDSSGKTLKVKTPIYKKLEKEGEEEDGFTTPKGAQFKIPPLVECPPAPARGSIQQKTINKRRKISTPWRLTSVNIQDLNIFFSRTDT